MGWVAATIQITVDEETRRAIVGAHRAQFPNEPSVILTLWKSKTGGVPGFGWVGELVDRADTTLYPEGFFVRAGDFDVYIRNQGGNIAELEGARIEYDTLIVGSVSVSPA